MKRLKTDRDAQRVWDSGRKTRACPTAFPARIRPHWNRFRPVPAPAVRVPRFSVSAERDPQNFTELLSGPSRELPQLSRDIYSLSVESTSNRHDHWTMFTWGFYTHFIHNVCWTVDLRLDVYAWRIVLFARPLIWENVFIRLIIIIIIIIIECRERVRFSFHLEFDEQVFRQ